MQLKLTLLTPRTVSFDLNGVDASIANAFRRIMIAEVPTMAIENVYVFDNTSVIVDEVLAQRLGMVPLNVNPEWFDFRGRESFNSSSLSSSEIIFPKINHSG